MLCLLLASCTDCVAPVYQGSNVRIIAPPFYKALEAEFKRYSYELETLDKGVPPIILKNIPGDMASIRSSQQKKDIFFKSLLPMILLANQEILFEREQLQKIAQVAELESHLTSVQKQVLKALAKRYKISFETDKSDQIIKKLEHRIDIIPADLALAQAANESAWGTSRFSRVANNLFGEWTYVKGQGIVPNGRPEDETYEVQKFDTVYESVRSYLNNLNTHSAYKSLRNIRRKSRSEGKTPDGIALAEGLLRYSNRGEDYIREIQSMIRKNQLSRLALAKLNSRG